jgi:hypothetical protein
MQNSATPAIKTERRADGARPNARAGARVPAIKPAGEPTQGSRQAPVSVVDRIAAF